jgi:spore coat protein U-like protein
MSGCSPLVAAPLAMALMTFAGATPTAQAVATVPVSARVMDECRVTPAVLDFGRYSPVGPNAVQPLDSDATFEVQCTPGATARVSLGLGQSPSGTQRRMASAKGRDLMAYDLYQDSGRSATWGAGDVVTLTSFGPAPVRLPVYGRVPGGQDLSIGSYADSVVITVTF